MSLSQNKCHGLAGQLLSVTGQSVELPVDDALTGTKYLLLLEELLACTRDNVPYSIYSCDYPRCCL